jgi:hypothetical protein
MKATAPINQRSKYRGSNGAMQGFCVETFETWKR